MLKNLNQNNIFLRMIKTQLILNRKKIKKIKKIKKRKKNENIENIKVKKIFLNKKEILLIFSQIKIMQNQNKKNKLNKYQFNNR